MSTLVFVSAMLFSDWMQHPHDLMRPVVVILNKVSAEHRLRLWLAAVTDDSSMAIYYLGVDHQWDTTSIMLIVENF